MTKKTLSVIVVAYQNLDCLAKCLDSIPNLPWIEVIVINNSYQNRGFGAGCNLGSTLASGQELVFVNPDCVVNRELLLGLRRQLSDNTVGMVAPGLTNEAGQMVLSVSQQPTAQNAWIVYSGLNRWLARTKVVQNHWYGGKPPLAAREVGIVSGALFGIRASVFKQLGGFDEHFFLYWEEVDLARRCLAVGYKVIFNPKLEAMHVGALSTRATKELTRIWFRESRCYFFTKHFGLKYATWLEGWLALWEHWPLVVGLIGLSLTGSVTAVVMAVMVYNEMILAGRGLAAITGVAIGLILREWGLWGLAFGLGWIILDLGIKQPIWRKLYLVGIISLCLAW